MDWKKVTLPETGDINIEMKQGQVSRRDYYQLRVIAAYMGIDFSALFQIAALEYLKNNWPDFQERLEIDARSDNSCAEQLLMNFAQRCRPVPVLSSPSLKDLEIPMPDAWELPPPPPVHSEPHDDERAELAEWDLFLELPEDADEDTTEAA